MFNEEEGYKVVNHPEGSDIICFTGGEDVFPPIYGEVAHLKTHSNPHRDLICSNLFQTYKYDKKFVGICRGAQILHVLNGGKLYQHVDNHGVMGTHKATVMCEKSKFFLKEIDVTSTHHQMMAKPLIKNNYLELLVTKLSKNKEGLGDIYNEGYDLEACFHKSTHHFKKVLCYQPHPEYVEHNHECRRLFFDFIKTYLGD